MTRIFVTGDTHRTIDTGKLKPENFPLQNELTRDDIVIIAGDFGLPWVKGENETDRKMLEWHENRPYTTLFIDGNHENFEAYEDYPETTFMGAKCHLFRPHIYHIRRGEVMEINGKKIWFFGGAISFDRYMREEHVSWWAGECPTEEEMEYGMKTLKENRPDIVITHEGPFSVITENNPFIRPNQVNMYLEEVKKTIENENMPVKEWFLGHHHIDRRYEKDVKFPFNFLYQEITEII